MIKPDVDGVLHDGRGPEPHGVLGGGDEAELEEPGKSDFRVT